jgi:hypothetical protein
VRVFVADQPLFGFVADPRGHRMRVGALVRLAEIETVGGDM